MPAPADFELHKQLAADTIEVDRWDCCRVLLMNDAAYPWLILVPQRAGVRELHKLSAVDLALTTAEIVRASEAMERLFQPVKMNVAALGNMVPQLHIHVIARFEDDPAWPQPVWGVAPAAPYGASDLAARVEALRGAFSH
ncbi:MAG: diadenosine tetraphosphate (Ap4A) HIT family hydrolase [Alphaproteobacteria bacterium]|jgi:diadenosine tetraphosphate (Ap4A) HIT family hydrolase